MEGEDCTGLGTEKGCEDFGVVGVMDPATDCDEFVVV